MGSARPVVETETKFLVLPEFLHSLRQGGVPMGRFWGDLSRPGVRVVETSMLPAGRAMLLPDPSDLDGLPTLIVGIGSLTHRQKAMIEYNWMIKAKVVEIFGKYSRVTKQDWGFTDAEVTRAGVTPRYLSD